MKFLDGARGAAGASVVAGVVLAVADALNGHPVAGLTACVALALVGAALTVEARMSTDADVPGAAEGQPDTDVPDAAGALRTREVQGAASGSPAPAAGWASARTAGVLMSGTVIGLTAEIVQGRDGTPFTWLALLGGATYLGCSLYARRG